MGGRIQRSYNGFLVSLSTFAAAQILRALPRVHLSRAVGRLCDQPIPSGLARAVERAYCRAYRVNKIGRSTRLNSSHSQISYAVFCLKKKKKKKKKKTKKTEKNNQNKEKNI